MVTQKKGRHYLKNSGDILVVVLSFLAAAFLAKRHAGAGAVFIDFRGWEFLLLLFLCLAWNYGARALRAV